MRKTYEAILKEYLHKRIVKDRKANHLIQEKMAELLVMDPRSYSDIERGKTMCSTLTFTLYLLQLCDDPETLLREIEELFAAAGGEGYDK